MVAMRCTARHSGTAEQLEGVVPVKSRVMIEAQEKTALGSTAHTAQ
jgi:hypothetical protein